MPAARAADRHLAHLHAEGAIAETAFVALRADIEKEQELSESLNVLCGAHPEWKANEYKTVQLESLRAQRQVFDLNRRSVISDAPYCELTAEIAKQQHALTTSDAARRAVASGPASDDRSIASE